MIVFFFLFIQKNDTFSCNNPPWSPIVINLFPHLFDNLTTEIKYTFSSHIRRIQKKNRLLKRSNTNRIYRWVFFGWNQWKLSRFRGLDAAENVVNDQIVVEIHYRTNNCNLFIRHEIISERRFEFTTIYRRRLHRPLFVPLSRRLAP